MISRLPRGLRTAGFLLRQRTFGFVVPDEPYFDAAARNRFADLLGSARLYLEYGAGGSTVMAAARRVPTISVENDRFFARSVRAKIGRVAATELIVIDTGLTGRWGVPLRKRATRARLARWRAYVEAPIASLASRTDFPDLILVDGRFRRACILVMAREALLRGASTTICVDDYVRRTDYHDVEKVLGRPALHGRMATFVVDGQDHQAVAAQLQSCYADWR